MAGWWRQNNVGLLARAWGKVTRVDPADPPAWFAIDDGSGVGVKCIVPPGVTVTRGWQFAYVTGISSCENVDGKIGRVLRIAGQSDIPPATSSSVPGSPGARSAGGRT